MRTALRGAVTALFALGYGALPAQAAEQAEAVLDSVVLAPGLVHVPGHQAVWGPGLLCRP